MATSLRLCTGCVILLEGVILTKDELSVNYFPVSNLEGLGTSL